LEAPDGNVPKKRDDSLWINHWLLVATGFFPFFLIGFKTQENDAKVKAFLKSVLASKPPLASSIRD
jgi:hypothetical protein